MNYIVGFLFLFSGATSLVYETIWIRNLSLGVGSTATSLSLVLSTFFFGLGLGSFLAGKWHHKVNNPLRFYGLVEGLIGLISLVIYFPLFNFHKVLAYLPLSEGSLSVAGTILKFALVFVILIIPTTAMGATLPFLVRILGRREGSETQISLLYSLNTFGGVIGTLATSFILIPFLGLFYSNLMTVAINLTICAVAWLLSRRLPISPAAGNQSPSPVAAAQSGENSSSLNLSGRELLILLVCGICGFSSIAAEVVWSKFLGIFLGTNIFGLGLLLSLFLTGIALGSLFLSFFIAKLKNRERFFLLLLFLATLTTWLSSWLLNWAPIASSIGGYYAGQALSLLTIKSIIAGFILFLPTLFFGALLPLAVSLIRSCHTDAPRVAGLAFSINTFGSILGSLSAGLLIIPLWGSSQAILIACTLLTIMFVLFVLLFEPTLRARASILVVTALALGGLSSLNPVDYRNVIKTAYYQVADSRMSWSEVTSYFSKEYEVFLKVIEGKTAIISLSHDKQDGEYFQQYIRLKTNGLNESLYSSVNPELLPKYEALLGLLPFSVHRDPKRAFIVGYGGGYTVDYLTAMGIEHVQVAELEEGIIEAAQFVYKGNNAVLKRPNLKLQIEDARYVLAAKLHGAFDIIVSQPSHSWLTGVANLFTYDFFEIVKSNLTPQGVFSQWLNLYNMDQKVLKSILRTFFEVFPHGAVFTNDKDEELIMIGSLSPVKFDLDKVKALARDARIRARLAYIPLNSAHDLLSNFALNRDEVLALTKEAPLNTDENAYAEVAQSRLFYTSRSERHSPQEFFSTNYQAGFVPLLPYVDQADFLYNTLISMFDKEKYQKFYTLLNHFEALAKDNPKLQGQLGHLCYRAQRLDCSFKAYEKAMISDPSNELLPNLLSAALAAEDSQAALRLANQYERYSSPLSVCYKAVASAKLGDHKSAERTLSGLSGQEITECDFVAHKAKGLIALAQNDLKTAQRELESYYIKVPKELDVLEKLIAVYGLKEKKDKLLEFTRYFVQLADATNKNWKDTAAYYRMHNLTADAQILEQMIARYLPPAAARQE